MVDQQYKTRSNYRTSTRRRHEPLIDGDTQHWKDTGCEESPSCLACPLPICRYDNPAWYAGLVRGRLDARILATYETFLGNPDVAGLTARVFGVSARTVHRVIKRAA